MYRPTGVRIGSLLLLHVWTVIALLCDTCDGKRQRSPTSALRAARHKWAGNQWLRAHEAGHIPEPPDLEQRMNNASRSSVAMCASMKAENMTDVREWLLYHRWLGVDHIYLTENVVEPVATTTEQLRDLVAEGLVTYSNERVAQAQMKVYYDCLAKHAHKHDWMAFFDMDEYVVLVDRPDQKLPDFLRAYRAYPGLAVHWVLVGPSGRDARPAAGGVLRHYAQCGGRGDQGIKMVVNTAFVANICPHPHNFEFRDGMPPVDENFEPIAFNPHLNALSVCSPIPPARSAPGTPAAALTAALPFERLEYWTNADGRYCYAWPYPSKASASVGKIALFHYVTKSLADFSAKMARGPGIGKSKTWEFLLNTTRTLGTRKSCGDTMDAELSPVNSIDCWSAVYCCL